MLDEILREVATLKDIKDAMIEHLLMWAHRVEGQRTQKTALNNIKETNELDTVSQGMQECDNET